MNFKEAYKQMENGYPIKRKSWGGYWYRNRLTHHTIMVLKNGTLLINTSDNLNETIKNILADDWEICGEQWFLGGRANMLTATYDDRIILCDETLGVYKIITQEEWDDLFCYRLDITSMGLNYETFDEIIKDLNERGLKEIKDGFYIGGYCE